MLFKAFLYVTLFFALCTLALKVWDFYGDDTTPKLAQIRRLATESHTNSEAATYLQQNDSSAAQPDQAPPAVSTNVMENAATYRETVESAAGMLPTGQDGAPPPPPAR